MKGLDGAAPGGFLLQEKTGLAAVIENIYTYCTAPEY
jgi:hypothetical protein